MSDPRNTADLIEAMSDDPHSEWDANRQLAGTAQFKGAQPVKIADPEDHGLRNGLTRVAIMGAGFGSTYAIGAAWPIWVAVGIMVIFQILNGEGFDE